MDEDWRNGFGMLMCVETCDGVCTGISDNVQSTCSSICFIIVCS